MAQTVSIQLFACSCRCVVVCLRLLALTCGGYADPASVAEGGVPGLQLPQLPRLVRHQPLHRQPHRPLAALASPRPGRQGRGGGRRGGGRGGTVVEVRPEQGGQPGVRLGGHGAAGGRLRVMEPCSTAIVLGLQGRGRSTN